MDTQRNHYRATRHLTRRLRIEALEDRRMLAVFSVSNLDDAGAGSLRQAILDANSQGGADTIDFSSGLFSTPQTINLDSALPTITEDLTIDGPGQQLLTLDAGNGTDNLPGTGDGYRLFDLDDNNPSNFLTVAIESLTLTGGDVTGDGGAIQTRENLVLTNVAIVNNATGPGTAGSFNGPGQSGGNGGRGGSGGGIFSSGGNLTVIDSTLSGNSTGDGGSGADGGDGADGTNGEDGGNGGYGGSSGSGGGIYAGGGLVITNSTISGNTTGDGGLGGSAGQGGEPDVGGIGGQGGDGGDGGYGGYGAGIYSSVGDVTITRSTISGNSTGVGKDGTTGGEGGLGALGGDGGDGGNGGSGGGLYSVEGRLEISMSTVTGNQASSGGIGGPSGSGGSGGSGGFVGNNGIDGNGGGVDSFGNDPVLIDNTILAANLSAGNAPDLRTGLVSLNIDFSLIGDGDGLQVSSGTGNLIGTGLAPIDPELGPLAKNGGPTQTHALLPTSPAIDAGDPSILFNASEFDQRGSPFVRVEDGDLVAGTIVDIGAYEAQAPPSADFDQDSDVDGSDFLRWQRGFGTTSGALLADGNSDDDEDVDASDLAVWEATYGEGVPAQQAQQAAPSVDSEIPLSQAVLVDLTFGKAEDGKQEAEVLETEFLSVETYAIAFAEIALATDFVAATDDSSASVSAENNDAATIDLELHDELLASLF